MPDDLHLLKALKSDKSEAALAELFELYANPVYRLAFNLVGDSAVAEDVLQDTFLAVMTHINEFEGRSRLGTWIYRIAYNFSQEHLRKKQPLPLPEEDFSEEEQSFIPQVLIDWRWAPDGLLSDKEAQKELETAIHKLPESLRMVFLLRDIEDLSTEETAEVLHLSPGAVKVRLHRARLELREQLSHYFSERLSKGVDT
jgi:RNA polymerase sigma-70 factor (ECF subfamily)